MSEKNKKILDLAVTRMSEAIEADRENRERDMDDLQKLIGKQWPDNIKAEREAANKPCITVNRLPQFVRQVTGDIRRMNPAINVTPSDQAASKDTAELLEGVIRQIEYASDASSIYEQTAESAAASSIGWFRVLNDWSAPDSFEQEAKLKRIRNAFSVYCDPAAEMPTREDAGYIFITEMMKREDFEEAYPNKNCVDFEHDGETDGLEHWQDGDSVIVAEYYWKEEVERELWLLRDGQTVFKDEAAEGTEEFVIRKRKVSYEKVMWAKISGADILEGPQEVPCDYIPVVAVTGEEWHVGEDVYRSSVIRFAKDPQQLYNYFRSSEAEMVTLQPKAPYIGTLKQFQGLETFWQNANFKNYSFLPYNPDEKAPGPPQRQSPPVASAGLSQQSMLAAEDMKATTGIYDAGLGNQSNEKSGVAIRQRQMESDISTSIYSDNMAKAIAHCGRILLSMIPRIYDTQRMVRIIGKDRSESLEMINGVTMQEGVPQPVNDVTVGKYDVRVNVGPNYSTRRQETAEGMLEFIRVVPGAAQMIGDLVAKAMDWPDAEIISERLEKALPPALRDQENIPPEQQQAAMAAQQQAQQAKARMQAAEIGKAEAEAKEAAADAQKAVYETEEKRLEALMKSEAMNEVIARAVQEQVARVLLSGTPAPMPGFSA